MTSNTNTTPRQKHGGRRAGVPNVVTRDLRRCITELVENNIDHAQEWLNALAAKHPGRALALMIALCEFAVPKLRSAELNVHASSSPLAPGSIVVTRETAMAAYQAMCRGEIPADAPDFTAPLEHRPGEVVENARQAAQDAPGAEISSGPTTESGDGPEPQTSDTNL